MQVQVVPVLKLGETCIKERRQGREGKEQRCSFIRLSQRVNIFPGFTIHIFF